MAIENRTYTREHTFVTADITVNPAVDNGSIGALIDGSTAAHCRLGTSGAERGFYTFDFRGFKYIDSIKFKHGNNDEWRIELSKDGNNFIIDQEVVFQANFGNETFYINSKDRWRFIRISTVAEEDGTGNQHKPRVFEFKAFTYDILDFDFNDSVLETKAWNSSRYDGRQLSAKKINKATIDDIGNNNKTPIIRNYTRNIYIGNEIVGMQEIDPEDPSLLQFPDFSYAQITTYITINEDGTISRNTLDPEEDNANQKKAFYRPFTYDFPEGSFCNFILGDPTVKNNLKSKYAIYFNGGQLKKLLTIQTNREDDSLNGRENGFLLSKKQLHFGDGGPNQSFILRNSPTTHGSYVDGGVGGNIGSALYVAGYKRYGPAGGPSGIIAASGMTEVKLDNLDIARTWFTGSLLKTSHYYDGSVHEEIALDFGEKGVKGFVDSFLSYKSGSSYKGDKRMFITACEPHAAGYFVNAETSIGITETQARGAVSRAAAAASTITQIIGNARPLYTFEAGSIHTSSLASQSIGIDTLNLNSLTTLELQSTSETEIGNVPHFEFAFNPNLSETYIDMHSLHRDDGSNGTIGSTRGKDPVLNFISGSIIFSVADDDTPSLLVKLKKERELQNGKGEKPFIVIPENIHPYIKDNLIFYLSKAGIDIGGSATDQVEENLAKKPKISELSPRERRLLALERLQQNLERRRAIETARRDRRRAITRREDREERRKRRVENRQERRKNRQDRKENRQENRQERRRNRRNRRRRR